MSAFLGIDVSKATLDVVLRYDDQTQYIQVSNDPTGYARVVNWVSDCVSCSPHAALEATGGHELAVAHYLYNHGYRISILETRQLKGFAMSIKQYNKTDKQDAHLLAHFCQLHAPDLWQPPEVYYQHLRERTRYLQTLKDDRQRLLNRRGSCCTDSMVCQSLTRRIKQIDHEIETLEHLITELIESHLELSQQRDLLTSITSIGNTTAAILIAEIGGIETFDSARHLASYAGITPLSFLSGTSVQHPDHISKHGNAHLRQALYFPAMNAIRWNPHCRALAQRLRKKHKHGKVIVIAVAHKLLRIAYGVLHSKQLYDPNYLANTA